MSMTEASSYGKQQTWGHVNSLNKSHCVYNAFLVLLCRSNQNYFSKVFLRPVGAKPATMKRPSVVADQEEDGKENEKEKDENEQETVTDMNKEKNREEEEEEENGIEDEEFIPPTNPLQDGILTLSDVPRQKWQNLTKLELIKVCGHFCFRFYVMTGK